MGTELFLQCLTFHPWNASIITIITNIHAPASWQRKINANAAHSKRPADVVHMWWNEISCVTKVRELECQRSR